MVESEAVQHGQHPAAAAASDVGGTLRRARERGGFDLAAIGGDLHIRTRYLLAIEDGRLRDLPGPAYAVGFVRSYATYLGLDAVEIVRRFKDESVTLSRGPELTFPSGVAEKSVPAGMLVAIALLALAVLYGLWYFIHARSSSTAELIQPAPTAVAAAVDPPAVSSISVGGALPPLVSSPVGNPPGSTVVSEAQAAPPPAMALTVPTQVPVPQPPIAAPAPQPQVISALPAGPPTLAGQSPAAPRVVLHANGTTWVQVRDGNGATLYRATMHKNDQYQVPGKQALRLRVGNARVIALVVDGKQVPSDITAGAEGHDLPLDPDRLAAGLPPVGATN